MTRSRTAFALPMTLVLLALAAAVMVNYCTRSVLLTAQAARANDDLQQRWAMASIRRAVLPQAETLLAEVNLQSPSRQVFVTLGGRRFDLTITDEQAKANVNSMLNRLGQSRTEQTLHDMLTRRSSDVRINLKPLQQSSAFVGASRIGSFSQMFDTAGPAALLEKNSVVASLTCFGDGRINLRRATYPALLGLTRELLTQKQVESLLQSQRDPDATIAQLLAPLGLTRESADAIRSLITFKSACHGLWITAEAQTLTPAATSFAAIDDAAGGAEQVLTW